MSGLKGFSYYQRRQLDALDVRLEDAENSLDEKQDRDDYDNDMIDLDDMDTQHFDDIEHLRETKAEVIEFNSRVQKLDGNDATHAALMNSLESDYNQKASKAGFEEKMKELNANDATHDVRLDALERQFDGIESRVLGEVNDKVNELALNTDFNALVAELQAKDTELGNKIITLAAKTDIDNALQNYQTLVAGLQTKTDYNAKMDKVVERHQDFEDRFTAIDQFFRAIAETYKLRRKNDLTEIVYNTHYQSDIIIKDSIFTVHRKNRSALGIRVTPFIYNSMTGKIQVRNSSGVVVGELTKSNISSVTYNREITFSSNLADSDFNLQVEVVNSVGDVTDKITVSKTSFDALSNHVAPGDVTGLDAIPGDGSATITFNPVDGATGYKYIVVGGDIVSDINNPVWTPVTINSLPYTITGLTNGISYIIVVKSVNYYGESPGATKEVSLLADTPILSANESYNVYKGIDTSIQIDSTTPASGWEMSGNIPPGLSINSNGQIVGIPTTEGQYSVTVSAIGSNSINITINVLPAWVQKGSSIYGENAGDYNGRSVSLSADGKTMAVGATYNDGPSNDIKSDRGQVRIYEWTNGDWVQKGSSIYGENTGDLNGRSVSLSADGNIVAMGAIYNDGPSTDINDNRGQVRVFEWANGDWVQKGDSIYAENSGDQNGYSVSLSADGKTMAVGAFYNDGPSNDIKSNRGQVRIYEWTNGNWVQKGDSIYGENTNDLNGISVSLSVNGNIVAMGSYLNDGPSNDIKSDRGQVRIYEWTNGNWVQKGSSIYGENTGDLNGRSVSLSADGNIVAMGAIYNDGPSTDIKSNRGQVRVFEWANGDWVQKGDSIYGENTNDLNGISVSLSANGNIVAMGSYLNDGPTENTKIDRGQVRIYELTYGYWVQKGNSIYGENTNDQNGLSVSLSADGKTVAMGSYLNDGPSNDIKSDRGQVRVFKWNESPILSIGAVPNMIVNESITPIQVINTGGAVNSWSFSSTVPGLSISSMGLITGTPTVAGVYNIYILADSVSLPVTFTIIDTQLILSVPQQQTKLKGGAISIQVSSSEPVSTYNPLTISPSVTGLSIDNTGLITGSINTIGQYTITVSGVTSTSKSGSVSFSLNVDIQRKFVAEWGHYLDGNAFGEDSTGGIATDANGNVYVVGYMDSASTTLYGSSTGKPTGSGDDGIYIVKYNSIGVRQWVRWLDGAGKDRSYNICCSLDSVYVVGMGGSGTTTTSFPSAAFTTVYGTKTSTNDAFIAALGFDGSRKWLRWLSGNGSDIAYNVYTKLDNDSVVYVCGSAGYPTTTLDPTFTGMGDNPATSGQRAGFLVKLNADGTYSWGKWIATTGIVSCEDIVMDSNNNVYVSGYASGSSTANTTSYITNIPKPNIDSDDSFIIKFNLSGAVQWGNWINSYNSDKVIDMAIGPNDTIYVTGYTLNLYNTKRIILGIYDSNGSNLGWHILNSVLGSYKGNSGDSFQGNGVVVDNDGYIYICGQAIPNSVSPSTSISTTTGITSAQGFIFKLQGTSNLSLVGTSILGSSDATTVGARFMTRDVTSNKIIIAGNSTGTLVPFNDASIMAAMGGNKPDTSQGGFVLKFGQSLL